MRGERLLLYPPRGNSCSFADEEDQWCEQPAAFTLIYETTYVEDIPAMYPPGFVQGGGRRVVSSACLRHLLLETGLGWPE